MTLYQFQPTPPHRLFHRTRHSEVQWALEASFDDREISNCSFTHDAGVRSRVNYSGDTEFGEISAWTTYHPRLNHRLSLNAVLLVMSAVSAPKTSERYAKHTAEFLYQRYIEFIASCSSALLFLSMQQVSIQTYSNSRLAASLQHLSTFSKPRRCFASTRLKSSSDSFVSSQVWESMAYSGISS